MKSKIDYGDYSWNFWIGCKGTDCLVKDICWAKKLNNRFKWIKDFRKPQFLKDKFNVKFPTSPSKILVCFTGDLLRKEVPKKRIQKTIKKIKEYPQHKFLFLTKNPKRYGEFKFPINCWLGTTYNTFDERWRLANLISYGKENIKYVSIEPIMDDCNTDYLVLMDWIIIGGFSGKSKIHPKKEWIQNILRNVKRFKKPVFIKDNIKWKEKLQEFPNIKNEEKKNETTITTS